jgi:hypothetical protein
LRVQSPSKVGGKQGAIAENGKPRAVSRTCPRTHPGATSTVTQATLDMHHLRRFHQSIAHFTASLS